MASLTDTFTQLTVQEAEEIALDTLLSNLGFWLALTEGATPLWPFIAIGFAIFDIVNAFGSGRPKDQDTNNVIWAYHMSAYYPLQALGSDLAIALKNGAPISDSRPQIQAQFSAWKQGTIQSIQALANQTPGPSGSGYWQLQQLINLSWVFSRQGQQAVLNIVKAIDKFTEGLSQLSSQTTTPPPNGSGGTGGGGTGGGGTGVAPCDSSNMDQDEILDLCQALQSAIANIKTGTATTPGSGDCCAAVVNAITSIAGQLAIIAASIGSGSNVGPPIDLTPIVTALAQLVAAVSAIAPGPTVDLAPLVAAVNDVAAAIASGPATDVSGIVTQLQSANTMNDVPQPIIDSLATLGLVSAADAQMAGGGPYQWITTLLHDEWRKLNHPPSPEEVAALKADPVYGPAVTAKLAGVPLPPFKEVLKNTPGAISEITKASTAAVANATFAATEAVFAPITEALLGVHEKYIAKFVNVQPGDEVTNATAMLSEALGAGTLAHWAAIAAETIYPSKHLGFTAVAALIAELAGFAEITKGLIGVEVKQAISVPHTYHINNQARAILPSAGQAAEMLSKRLITQAQYDTLVGFGGINPNWEASLQNNAYRAMSPMMLAAGFANADIDMTLLTSVLQYMGLRPKDIPIATQAIVTRSLQQTRQALVNEAISAYGQGVVADAELQQILTDAGYGKSASALVMQRALIARRITLAKESESYVVPEVVAGLLSEDQGLQALEAAGVQPWQAQLKMTLAATKAELQAARKALAAEKKLALQRQREETKVAIQGFETGGLDAAALTAALIAIGLDPTLVGSTVAVEEAKRAGRLKLVYGQYLAPLAAKRLTEQVGALENQFKQVLIDDTAVQAGLQALGIDQPEVTALMAQWAAVRGLTAKAPELLQTH